MKYFTVLYRLSPQVLFEFIWGIHVFTRGLVKPINDFYEISLFLGFLHNVQWSPKIGQVQVCIEMPVVYCTCTYLGSTILYSTYASIFSRLQWAPINTKPIFDGDLTHTLNSRSRVDLFKNHTLQRTVNLQLAALVGFNVCQ